MKEIIWHQDYEVNTLLIDADRRLGFVGLLGILQDTAHVHAKHLGHDLEAMAAHGVFWIIAHQRVVIHAWPEWEERVRVRTWIRPAGAASANRDFELFVGNRRIGECVTNWATLDAQSRRPRRIDPASLTLFRKQDTLPLEVAKVRVTGDLIDLARTQVRNSDLDMNGHVNNTRYAQWILDALPYALVREYHIDEYEVSFLAETHLGDRIVLRRGDVTGEAGGQRTAEFQAVREADGKAVFAARIRASPRTTAIEPRYAIAAPGQSEAP